MAHTNGTRILVVDDEPSIVDAVATALRYEGYEVEEARNGRDALEAVVRTEPDLVVLDWMLPDIEGIEVGRRLRARGFETAILFLTAKDATENKVEALRAGGDDYVTKPFSLAEIVARVQAILRRTGGDLPGDVLSFTDIVLDEAPASSSTAARATGGRYAASPPGPPIQLRAADGTVVCSLQAAGFGEVVPPCPDLPAEIAPPEGRGPGSEQTFTVSAVEGDERYRVLVSNEREGVLIVASSLADVDATLARLIRVEIVVTALVLGALAVLGLWLVGVGLRPLDAIGATAAAIADGDLSERVERAEPTTEVGRLGASLNAMLGQFESAFRQREASEQRLRRFVADASHELRTPLAAVRAYAELFERGAAQRPEDIARSMAGITRESERMSLLVDDLLLLARLDEGRPLERKRVELEDLVVDAVETARAVEPERAIELTTEPVEVVGDAHRLRQVVDNLLANARSHTPAGTPVSVTLAANDGHAVIEVARRRPGHCRRRCRAGLRALLPRRRDPCESLRRRRAGSRDRRRGGRRARRLGGGRVTPW